MLKLILHDYLTEEFLSLIQKSLRESSLEEIIACRIYDNRRLALVFSFDMNWDVFIGYTKGYNQPKGRIYLEQPPTVIEMICNEYKNLRDGVAGGRFFVDDCCTYYINENSEKVILYNLEWHNDRNVPEEIQQYFSKIRLKFLRDPKIRLKLLRDDFD